MVERHVKRYLFFELLNAVLENLHNLLCGMVAAYLQRLEVFIMLDICYQIVFSIAMPTCLCAAACMVVVVPSCAIQSVFQTAPCKWRMM